MESPIEKWKNTQEKILRRDTLFLTLHNQRSRMLRSAVGKTHVLRSDLWWTIPLHILHWSFWDTLRIPTDQVALARHSGVQVPVPVPAYGSTWVVLWLLFCRSAPSTFPVTWSTLKGPFRLVPSLRLYSEIDHIHLSSEAQCVSHHLPLVDCHTGSSLNLLPR